VIPSFKGTEVQPNTLIHKPNLYVDPLSASFRTGVSDNTYVLPDLPYDFSALEPVIDGETMKTHHGKHHAAYVTNLNAALEKYRNAEATNNLPEFVSLQQAIRFNGGGHINHSIFWTNLAPTKEGGGQPPSGDLATQINNEFGSLDKFINQFNTTAAGIQGSGWGWLVYKKSEGRLSIVTRGNQDPVSIEPGLVPLLGIDVWEHAYYLQYKNQRAQYLKEIWKVVNWANVAQRYQEAQK